MNSFITGLLILEGFTFLAAALLHVGVQIGGLSEPPITPAAIVESVAGLGLLIAATSRIAGAKWQRAVTVGTLTFALAGVLLGLTVLALAGGGTPLNDAYHRTLLLVLLATLLLQLTAGRRRPDTSSIVAP
jgi:hypothetical protein